jgi:DNA repair protein RadD
VSQLRDYQTLGLDQIRAEFKKGIKKVLLKLPTGGGKTVIFSEVLKTTAYNGHRAMMVVRGRKLVDQASSRLSREGVHHGVLMSNHWNYRPAAPIQICSIDTLMSRNIRPPAKVIVIDEAHLAVSAGYVKFCEAYPDAFFLPVTATPYGDKSLRHVADTIVQPISMKQLIAQGYLVGFKYYSVSQPNLAGVKVSSSTHDYVQDQLADVMQGGNLMGDTVKTWLALGEGRPTICFAVTVEHSKNIVMQFVSQGVAAEHCDADTPDEEREAIYKRLESGQTKVVSNVGILCTGVDLPFVSCIIEARPTKSYNLYCQQLGRGTRTNYDSKKYPDGFLNTIEGRICAIDESDKKDCIILDHAGNVVRFGFPTDEPEANLDGKEIKLLKSPKTCQICFAVFYGFQCPAGCILPEDQSAGGGRGVVQVDGQLQQITEIPFEMQVQFELDRLKKVQKARGFKTGWVFFRLAEKYGNEVAERFIPKRQAPFWHGGPHGPGERSPSGDLGEAQYASLEILPRKGTD